MKEIQKFKLRKKNKIIKSAIFSHPIKLQNKLVVKVVIFCQHLISHKSKDTK
jgi:hypothetical protein